MDIPTHLGSERTTRIPGKPEEGVQELAAGHGSMTFERADHRFFLALTTVVAFEIGSHYLQSLATSHGFFGDKISRCARADLLQMVLDLHFHHHRLPP